MLVSINLVAVLVASIVTFMLGWIWYSPLLFGNFWMKELGIKPPEKMTAEMRSQMLRSMSLGFIFSLVTNYVLAHFLAYMNVSGFNGVAQLAVWLWLGFTLPVVLSGYLWERKSLSLVAIGAAFYLLALLVGGMILTSM